MNSIRQILRLGSWSAIAGVSNVVVLALLYWQLTHFLSQQDLGTYAIVSSVMLLAVSSIEFSFSTGLISLKKITKTDYQAVFTINLIIAAILSLALIGLSFIIGTIYSLSSPMLILSLLPILFLTAFNSPQLAGMKKNLDFKKIAQLDLVSLFVFSSIALLLAIKGYGYWSLILALLCKYLSYTIMLILTRSTFCGSIINIRNQEVSKHFRFGKYVMYEKLFTSGLSYLDVFLVGYFVNLQLVGVYDVLKKIIMRPCVLAYQYLEDVVFPLLCQDNISKKEYNVRFNNFISISSITLLPVLALIHTNSSWIISFLPLEYHEFQSLIAVLITFTMAIILLNPLDIILYSHGRSKIFFSWYFVVGIIQIVISLISLQFSVFHFLVSMSIYYFLLYLIAFPILIFNRTFLSANNYFASLGWLSLFVGILCFAQMFDLTTRAAVYTNNFLIIILTIVLALYFPSKTKTPLPD